MLGEVRVGEWGEVCLCTLMGFRGAFCLNFGMRVRLVELSLLAILMRFEINSDMI